MVKSMKGWVRREGSVGHSKQDNEDQGRESLMQWVTKMLKTYSSYTELISSKPETDHFTFGEIIFAVPVLG